MLTDRIDLLVLDKDGVLLDFHALWGAVAAARIEVLCERSARPDLRPELAQALGLDLDGHARPDGVLVVGTRTDSLRAAAGVLARAGRVDADDMARAAYVEADRRVDRVSLSRPLPGAIEAVRALAAQGFRLAIATTDHTDAARRFLAANGVESLFASVVGADRVAASKPAPDMFALACAEAGVAPARAAMIGDAPVDLAMGRAAGAALTIGLLCGVSGPEDLREADRLASGLAALAMLAPDPGYT